MRCRNPFPLADRLDAKLQAVASFWRDLIRAENRMPYTDDFNLSAFSKLSGSSFLLSAFTLPERFRFEFLDKALEGTAVSGRFVDEVMPDAFLCFLRAQSSATIEAGEPTLFHLIETSGRGFSRLLLPMWGNGQINTLLGAIDR